MKETEKTEKEKTEAATMEKEKRITTMYKTILAKPTMKKTKTKPDLLASIRRKGGIKIGTSSADTEAWSYKQSRRRLLKRKGKGLDVLAQELIWEGVLPPRTTTEELAERIDDLVSAPKRRGANIEDMTDEQLDRYCRKFENQDVKKMNADEAKECVRKIKVGLESLRNLILDLYERKGWQALGYKSWRECVTSEFPQRQRYLYYELKAAQTERNLDLHPGANIPEKHLRPLSRLEDPEQQKEAWKKAVETAPESVVTGQIVEEIVEKMTDSKRPKDSKPTQSTILDQLKHLWSLATEEERNAFKQYTEMEDVRLAA
jgi:hypothetical protein